MKTVLAFMSHYLPGYKAGGPIRTVANMVEALGDGIDYKIVTADRDLLDVDPYRGVLPGKWQKVGKASVMYLSPEMINVRFLISIIKREKFDVLYLNSLFSFWFSILPHLLFRIFSGRGQGGGVVLAPRGELSMGALSIKPLRKRVFLLFSGFLGAYRDLILQASSLDEANDIKKNLPSARRVVVARDLPDLSFVSSGCRFNEVSSALRVIFLSRISPMKNLHFALEVLAGVKVPVVFDIWGTEEDLVYWSRCKEIVGNLPGNISVKYCGPVSHDLVSETMARYDLFFLPSLGENYGHVIAEAVSVGTPVLISDRTPWRGLAESGAGWDLALEGGVEPFALALQDAYGRVQGGSAEWRERVYLFAKSFLVDQAVLDSNRSLFEQSC